jgi:hypothetical protein
LNEKESERIIWRSRVTATLIMALPSQH